MKQRLFEEMPAEEFEEALDRFIVREPAEAPISVFFEALAQIDRSEAGRGQVPPIRVAPPCCAIACAGGQFGLQSIELEAQDDPRDIHG